MNDARRVTRLAPSPTGALHLGNARTFLVNWALARQQGWRIAMRMEDLDGPRIKEDAAEQTVSILRWLGLTWAEPILYQSADLCAYQQALMHLHGQGLLYPCTCTRKEIRQAQSAPHDEDGETPYPGTCRMKMVSATSPKQPNDATARGNEKNQELNADRGKVAWRVMAPEAAVTFRDELGGPQEVDVQAQVGDFVVATKAGLPAYQLAVVVDDARQGVTEVMRGDDLLRSTARQLWLYQLLDLGPPPRYYHVPLVLGADGRRLAKRHGDTRLTSYRDRGVAPERIVGLLARWSGICDEAQAMSADEFARRFELERLPRAPATLTHEDEAWLCK